MSGVRLNTEKKIENDSFEIKIGTTNKLNPVVIYVEGKAFITPSEENTDYSQDISEIKHALRRAISDSLSGNDIFDKKFILDFQVATNGINVGKKSFMSFQFLLRQKNETPLKLTEIKEISENEVINIANILRDSINCHGFSISKTKK